MAQRPACLEEDPAFITRQTPDVFTRLLPDATLLHLEACEIDDTTAQIPLAVQSTQPSSLSERTGQTVRAFVPLLC